jgi:signal transduction histidine kinase
VPDDVPVEEPARRVNAPDPPGGVRSAAGPHSWEGTLRGWELLLVASVVIPAVFLALNDRPVGEKALPIVLLLAIIPLYVLLGRPAIVAEDRRRPLYIVLLLVLFSPAVVIAPAVSFALFGLCPQCFMALETRWAVAAVIAFNVPPGLGVVLLGNDSVFNLLTLTMITVFFSGVFGVWVQRIMRQSEERAELIAELEASRAEVARLSAERGAMAERERLAGEIHDTLAQGFTSIIMLIQAAQAQPDPTRHLALAVQTSRENLAEARALIAALGPAPLDEGSSLEDALRRLTARLGEETELEVRFTTRGRLRPLPPAVEVVMVRAAQEGIANVRRHAAARSVSISMEYGERDVTLRVCDDGRGFDTEQATPGFGLRAMRSRVEQQAGTVHVESAPGRGTCLDIVLPYAAATAASPCHWSVTAS